MAKTYVFGSTPSLAAEALACAQASNLEAGIIVSGAQKAEDYQKLGACEVVAIRDNASLPENSCKTIVKVLKSREATAFIALADTTGRDIAARVAGYFDAPMISEATDLQINEDGMTAKRLAYGGAVVYEERVDGFGVVGIAPGAYMPAQSDQISSVVNIEGQTDERMICIEECAIEKVSVDLTKAENIVCAGMGFTTKEELQTAYNLAEVLGAEVGCTRGLAENNKWFSEYIGLSGLQVKPKLYLALGVSGQVQHMVGVRGAQTIVAVTKDKEAPILKICDYGIIGDLFDISESLIAGLK